MSEMGERKKKKERGEKLREKGISKYKKRKN